VQVKMRGATLWAFGLCAVCACAGGSGGGASVEQGDAGTATPSAPGDAGSADAGTGSVGSVDAGNPPTDGGTASADCQGIVPAALGNSAHAIVSDREGEVCFDATTDSAGNVAAESHSPSTASRFDWLFFTPEGIRQGKDTQIIGDVFAQGLGFEAARDVQTPSGVSVPAFVRISPAGAESATQLIGNDETGVFTGRGSPDGLLAITVGCSLPPGTVTMRRFAEDGSEMARSGSETGGCTFLGAAASAPGGAVLVLLQGSDALGFPKNDILGRWYKDDGTTLTPLFVVGQTASSRLLVRTLLTGDLAIQDKGHWLGVLEANGGRQLKPAPAWLTDGHDFTVVRGQGAYARIPKTGSDLNQLDLFSAQGTACGTVTFPGVSGLAIGTDGTVIGASGNNSCIKTWWSGLLK
jgi:hypothetical protein